MSRGRVGGVGRWGNKRQMFPPTSPNGSGDDEEKAGVTGGWIPAFAGMTVGRAGRVCRLQFRIVAVADLVAVGLFF